MATAATRTAAARKARLDQQAGELLQAAYDMALDPNTGENCRVGAMKLFLAKTLPDLKSLEVKADVDMVIEAIEQRIIDPAS